MRMSNLKTFRPVWLTPVIIAGTSALIYHRLYYHTIPNRLLAVMKAGFVSLGTIESSWINMYPTTIKTAADQHVRVYTGGLTIHNNQTRQQFEFAVQPDGTLWRLSRHVRSTAKNAQPIRKFDHRLR
ncbi:small secreted protein [Lacticaseibacillus chiayiensis]|uniref:Small secreted protein n=1 Tax=Lacticaseibacillus chiayiensis TaxID=2100821 RepID=A0A4Q1UD91_9LACO|nr:hypothetical protein [Lacticaseibacillus chiayiensis]RXT29623.1 small secreted protein [Lacticaseibacillus chiayiensis]UYN55435.1 hypothetical protein OFW50_07920 [Lacticaseibacillus chiayiensis]